MIVKNWLKALPFILLIFSAYSVNAQTLSDELEAVADIIVDINGTGDYTTVAAGLNAVPDFNDEWMVVYVKKGTYYEKIILNHKKTKVVLVGEDVDSTIITYDDHAEASLPGHTFSAYTFRADPHDFQAYNITFEATSTASQAVAYHSNGDRQILFHCKFLGNQDTYFDNFRTRRYFLDSYIEGDVDFIFGFGVSMFDSCHVHINDQGYATAAATPQYYEFGYVFKHSYVTVRDGGTWYASLGRPWFDYANTIFFECWLHERIIGQGWSPWGGREETCIYQEYNNFGPGSDTTNRAEWSSQLDPALAPRYNIDTIFAATNFPSDLGPVVDSLEFWSMRDRFEEAGYAERADTILYAGRDEWPEYPTDNWHPEFYQPVYAPVREYTDFFYTEIDTTTTSALKFVSASDHGISVINPMDENLIINSENFIHGEVIISLYDLQGRKVIQRKLQDLPNGKTEIPLQTLQLPGGMYIYSVEAENFRASGKLLKQ
ncbi:MAG: T9SS type A sorting domain-containing protein [Bacteroidetes bacterium]|nr:T9SS type A sorting domain-containing protein [Bacteroidota bacterium]